MEIDFARRHAAPIHFRQRCSERGITQTPVDDLYQGLAWARANKREDIAEIAATIKGVDFVRFRCPDGIFYAVFPDGWTFPATVYTQEIFRKKRWMAKKTKRGSRRP